ncbi:MAG TPA: trypsin-like peptidase domain-containing protein [Pyrinomonadaceae bacterium]|jgi:serine protease Do
MASTHRIFSVVLVVLFVSHFASAQQLRDSFRRVKSAVVVVHSGAPEGPASPATVEVDQEGLGSGVLISMDGKILTAAHLVEKENGIKVEFANGQRTLARVIASSTSADLALLQVDRIPQSAVPAKLGDSDIVETGDDIFIVGAPYGLSYTLTVGRISGRRPDETRGGILSSAEFLQTDAVINPGNSGSPVFNKQGEVVGIVSSIISDSEDFKGVGFAATVNAARSLLLNEGASRTGLEGVLVTGIVAKALNVPQAAGFLVTAVAKDSLAEGLGLKGGDIDATIDSERVLIGGDVILEVNGKTVAGNRQAYRSLLSSIAASKPGTVIRCRVMRAGKILELSAKTPPGPQP